MIKQTATQILTDPLDIGIFPAGLKDHDCSNMDCLNKIDKKGNKKILYPMQHIIGYANIFESYKDFIALTDDINELDTSKEVVRDKRWIRVMQDEISSLENNRTWDVWIYPQ